MQLKQDEDDHSEMQDNDELEQNEEENIQGESGERADAMREGDNNLPDAVNPSADASSEQELPEDHDNAALMEEGEENVEENQDQQVD